MKRSFALVALTVSGMTAGIAHADSQTNIEDAPQNPLATPWSRPQPTYRFVDPGLFRAEIVLPPEAPTGEYQTEVWLFQNGRAISVRRGEITVRKVGIERFIYDFAHRLPWLYGLVSVFIALITGWAASTYFRRT